MPVDRSADSERARLAASERLQAEGLRLMLELGMSPEEACELMAEARRRGREAGEAARDAS